MTNISPESPEARRKRLVKRRKSGRQDAGGARHTRAWEILKRVAVGVYSEGFIHAGNLAYLSLLTLFPFFIVAAAVARVFGQTEGGIQTVEALLQTMPQDVAEVLAKPIRDVLTARSGNLLWVGAMVGLWTTGSFIETVRDIIRRAYGVDYTRPFWEYRLGSIGIIIGSVLILLIAFSITVLLSGIQQFIEAMPGFQMFLATVPSEAHRLIDLIPLFGIVPAVMLFGSLYLLFLSLTPRRYLNVKCLKWPGPAFVTLWWIATVALLPRVLTGLGGYDLTYGSLAGVMIALIFFFVIGLGVVIGAHLNAALAEAPEPEPQELIEATAEGTR